MSHSIRIHDKVFSPYLTSEIIIERIAALAQQIETENHGAKPVFLVVLNGAFLFAAELIKRTNLHCEVEFVRLASYSGLSSTGDVKTLLGLGTNIEGRDVIVIEDIVDTGNTIRQLFEQLTRMHANSIKIATLLYKPDAYQGFVNLDYVGFEIPDDFVVGFGLDYDGYGRNINGIYKIIDKL